jgi:methyl-accepting chemotaxis protein
LATSFLQHRPGEAGALSAREIIRDALENVLQVAGGVLLAMLLAGWVLTRTLLRQMRRARRRGDGDAAPVRW